MTSHSAPEARSASGANVALGLALLSVLLYVVALAVAGDDDSENGWLWPVAAVVGGAAAFAGWRAGSPRPRGKALAALLLGGLVFLSILGWIVVAAFSGNL
jgi:peptidoglycan/LPS O-acetylase OafA/YrhL